MLDPSAQRRHDLDALRAFAMLLGIALHSAMSFLVAPWPVQDTQQSGALGIFLASVHGFRMQLFFLISGFFTAMMWRRRGIKALLGQRFQRVFVPCLLGLITIMPTLRWVSNWAVETTKRERAAKRNSERESQLVAAIKQKDRAAIQKIFAQGIDPNGKDADFGVILLSWAAMCGDVETTLALLEKGADVDARNGDGSTPLHGAAFLGYNQVAEVLIRKGADVRARNSIGDFPYDSANADEPATRFIMGLLQLPPRTKEEIVSGRRLCQRLLPENPEKPRKDAKAKPRSLEDVFGVRSSYQAFLVSNRLLYRRTPASEPFHFVFTDVFGHLWFLWFLCWFIPFFVVYAWISERRQWKGAPRSFVLSPKRYLWLLPLTLIPQYFMGVFTPSFGPDTATGLLPHPHLLLYYGIFFGFGALYYDAEDTEGQVGKWWAAALPIALLVLLPIGLMTTQTRLVSGVAQALYTWLMVFGMMGLFRNRLPRENKSIRYLSDASYWLYLAHLPLVTALQQFVRTWSLPAGVKFTLICVVATGTLLLSYQLLVRYTWIGLLLNGRRARLGSPKPRSAEAGEN